MVEEMISGGIFYNFFYILFPLFTVGGVAGAFLIVSERKRYSIFGIFLSIFSVILLIILAFFILTEKSEYYDAIYQQIDSLDCEDLREAYNIYELEFIKDKFIFECIDKGEDWWR